MNSLLTSSESNPVLPPSLDPLYAVVYGTVVGVKTLVDVFKPDGLKLYAFKLAAS